MSFPIKAVIFDMDGVIVDSEPLWRRAMIEGFTGIGIPFTEDDCRKTTGTRFKEVVELWLEIHKVKHPSPKELELSIMSILLELIRKEGKAIAHIPELIAFCRSQNLKIGLATSSSHSLMNSVLDKLQLHSNFDATVSAEFMPYGKPHPEVFLECARQLGVLPSDCIVIEDSLNGVVAAKAAQMKVVAVPDPDHLYLSHFALADYRANDMKEVLSLFKTLFL